MAVRCEVLPRTEPGLWCEDAGCWGNFPSRFFLFTGCGIVVVAPARLEAHAVRFSRRGALLLFKTDKSLSVLTRTSLRGSEV